MEKQLSIIIPVYNKAMSLENCLDSVLKLKLDKSLFEVILVDDQSTDESIYMIKQYQKKYDIFKLIELTENTGSPSTPRNVGIENAVGEYLILLDADDWLDEKGVPLLLEQARENQSDFAFGQAVKYTEKSITKLAAFASYKEQNNLTPYEIDKIFRAVGPPGKMFKRSLIVDNHIKFKNMRYGEDKLFFTEAIGKSKTASMNPYPMYYVNRFKMNQSLVGETSIIEKSQMNLLVLEDIIQLNILEEAKNQAIHRIVEVDFLARLFNRKRFLKAQNKSDYYEVFKELLNIMNQYDLDIENYITNPKLKVIYILIIQNRFADLIDYIHLLVKGLKANKYIEDNIVHFQLPENLQEFHPIVEEAYGVYHGSSIIDGEQYEMIKLYTKDLCFEKVKLVEISNEMNSKIVPSFKSGDMIYIKSADVSMKYTNFNIVLVFNNYINIVVQASEPGNLPEHFFNRQNFKTEFISLNFNKNLANKAYMTYISQFVKHIISTDSVDILNKNGEVVYSLDSKTVINVNDYMFDKEGIPYFKTNEGNFVYADMELIAPLDINVLKNYIVDVPKKVEIIKECKLYQSVDFKTDHIKVLKVGETVDIESIEYTNKLTPRLVTRENQYITANKKFVKQV